jgi:hypothetical protein
VRAVYGLGLFVVVEPFPVTVVAVAHALTSAIWSERHEGQTPALLTRVPWVSHFGFGVERLG